MKHQETFSIESENPIDPKVIIGISKVLEQQGFDVYLVDLELYSLMKCKRLLAEDGASHILSLERAQEALLPRTERQHLPLLAKMLVNQLNNLKPSQELIVIDQYFFHVNADDRPGYLGVFKDIFAPFVSSIATLTFITGRKYDQTTYEEIKQILVEINPRITIVHRITNAFHDRFWIVDRARGMFIGSSLNRIGRQYALTDYLRDEDAAAIVEALKLLNLISD